MVNLTKNLIQSKKMEQTFVAWKKMYVNISLYNLSCNYGLNCFGKFEFNTQKSFKIFCTNIDEIDRSRAIVKAFSQFLKN